MMQHYDYLIVGSGLFGATVAWRARQAGRTSLVIDKREHTGGNIYCRDVEGIHVHQYGAHIFHTSDRRVWQMVNSLVEFNRYTNSPVANYQGRLYNLPFNMNTFNEMWGVRTPAEALAKIDEQRVEAVARMKADGASEPRNLEEQALTLIGRDIYERLIKGYTEKQWGRKCTDLPAFIIKRLPVRLVFDNNYFNDLYQGIPVGGYNKLTAALLDGVETRLGTDFFELRRKGLRWDDKAGAFVMKSAEEEWTAARLVYTGPIDEFFDYRLGRLSYRTVRFETEVVDTPNYQGNAVVNYTEASVPYTRVIEHKHFECFGQAVYDNPKTVVSREYSTEWTPGMEPYYPVNDDRNNALAQQYRDMAKAEEHVLFGGRLAEYRYYDMAPVIAKALDVEL